MNGTYFINFCAAMTHSNLLIIIAEGATDGVVKKVVLKIL